MKFLQFELFKIQFTIIAPPSSKNSPKAQTQMTAELPRNLLEKI
jgi:hypothetical protein